MDLPSEGRLQLRYLNTIVRVGLANLRDIKINRWMLTQMMIVTLPKSTKSDRR